MSELFSVYKRLVSPGLIGALVVALAVLGTLWGQTGTAFAQPANDNVGSAELITVLPYHDEVDTTLATLELGEPMPSCVPSVGNTVWYELTNVDGDATVSITTEDTELGPDYYDTVVAVYDAAFNEIACNDDGGPGLTSLIEGLILPAVDTYYIQVGSYISGGGYLILDIDVDLPDVDLVHVNPDGSDFTGNPVCPGGADPHHDCNNIIGADHVIRTSGLSGLTNWLTTGLGWDWSVQNSLGANANETPATSLCGDLDIADEPGWDPANDDELCISITSTSPGETIVSLDYEVCVWLPPVDPADPPEIFCAAGSTPSVVKEWLKLEYTILTGGGSYGMAWDPQELRNFSAGGPVHLDETVYGWNAALGDDPMGDAIPVEGAVFDAWIESQRGCTYFTDPFGVEDFGDEINGISNAWGEFVGPHVIPADSQVPPGFVNLNPLSHTGSSWPYDADWDEWFDADEDGVAEPGEFGLWIDTSCEELVTVHILVGYPDWVASNPQYPDEEVVTVDWQTIEVTKQPQIRWAGEKIVLSARWALPDDTCWGWGADEGPVDTDFPPDGFADTYWDAQITYVDLGGPGSLEGAWIDSDNNGWLDTFVPASGGTATAEVDNDCISRALYNSEEPGQANVDVMEHWTTYWCPYYWDDEFGTYRTMAIYPTGGGSWACYDPWYYPPMVPEQPAYSSGGLNNQAAFEVWYLKIYDIQLRNVDGERAYHNAGAFNPGNPTPEGETSGTVNVSADTLLGVQVKGWFYSGNLSGRGDTCVDIDGDGDGTDGAIPGPYSTTSHEGCLDPDDELLLAGFWVLPDDLLGLAGPDIDMRIPTWDVMNDPEDGSVSITCASALMASCVLVGPKDATDSHDLIVRPWLWLPQELPPFEDKDGDTWLNWDEQVFGSDPEDPLSTPEHLDVAGTCTDTLDNDDDGKTDAADSDCDINTVTYRYGTVRKSIAPDGQLTISDAIMPPLKITAQIADPGDAGFLWEAWKVTDLGITAPYASVMIPSDLYIPPNAGTGPGAGGYDWDSWGFSTYPMGPYGFYAILTTLPAPSDNDPDDTTVCEATAGGVAGPLCNDHLGNQAGQNSNDPYHPRKIAFYTDNRGWGFFFANGDYNLSFDDCAIQALFGAPDCDTDDVVGTSEITVLGNYPYFRKHSAVRSNPVEKTWIWGGYKLVTHVRIDATHTAILAHLKDRDGFCKFDVDVDDEIDVVFSPSEHPVQGEEIIFILNTEVGSIVSISPNGVYDAPHTPLGEATVIGIEDGVLIDRSEAVALAEDVRVLAGLGIYGIEDAIDDEECMAYIVIEHPVDEDPDVSVYFNDPEGVVTRHWPPTELLVNLVAGWNDACYVGPEATVEEAAAELMGDLNESGVIDLLAVYRLKDDQTWDGYFPGSCETVEGLCTINEENPLMPYDQLFVLMEIGMDWLQEITTAPESADLVEAWNSICYAGDSKNVEDATSNIIGDFEILYTLGSDQIWRRFVPGRADLTNIVTLNKYTSVFLLVTAEDVDGDGVVSTWVFDP